MRNVLDNVRAECKEVARKAVALLDHGAFGIFEEDLFVTSSGQVTLNKVAPCLHNTGHYTQDACAVSQFKNHLRAVCGMDLGNTNIVVGAAASE